MGLFGFEFKSREERERDEQDYLYRIFPGGKEQKAAVEKELASRLPGEDKKALLLYYVLMRDAMTGRDALGFEAAVAKLSRKQQILKASYRVREVIKEIMDENG